MSLSVFGEKAMMPNDEMVGQVCLDSKRLWDGIKNHIAATCENGKEEWKYYSKSAGWTLVMKSGKRTLLYLIPLNGSFKVNFVFGEKAAALAQQSELPESVRSLILEAKPYMEGRSFQVDVKTEEDLDVVIRLLEMKA